MSPERVARVAEAFARRAVAGPPARLCSASVDVLNVSGAGVTIMTGDNSGPVCSSNDRAGVIDELQFSLGEGPCRDAYATGAPVGEPDLERARPIRWPAFTPAALAAGAAGVFAFPINVGANRIGVLTLHQERVGALSAEQAADSLVVADVLGQTMLTMQHRSGSDVLAEGLDDAGAHRAEVHQAAGMVAVQLQLPVADALARVRAYAYANDRTVVSVAQDIVARRLHLGTEETGGDLE